MNEDNQLPFYSKHFKHSLDIRAKASPYSGEEKNWASDFLIQTKYLLSKYGYFKEELITYHHDELGLSINTIWISEIYDNFFSKEELCFMIEKSNKNNIGISSDTIIEFNNRRNLLITEFVTLEAFNGDFQKLQEVAYGLNVANRLFTAKIYDLNLGQLIIQTEFSSFLGIKHILELIFNFTYFTRKIGHYFLKTDTQQITYNSLTDFLRNNEKQEHLSRITINLLPFKSPVEILVRMKNDLSNLSIESHISTDQMALFILDHLILKGLQFKTEAIVSLTQCPHLYTMLLRIELISEEFKDSNLEIKMINTWNKFSNPNQGIELLKDGSVGFYSFFHIDFDGVKNIVENMLKDYLELVGIVEYLLNPVDMKEEKTIDLNELLDQENYSLINIRINEDKSKNEILFNSINTSVVYRVIISHSYYSIDEFIKPTNQFTDKMPVEAGIDYILIFLKYCLEIIKDNKGLVNKFNDYIIKGAFFGYDHLLSSNEIAKELQKRLKELLDN